MEDISVQPTRNSEVSFGLLRDMDGLYGIGLEVKGKIKLRGLFDVPNFIVRPDALYPGDKYPTREVAFSEISLNPIFDDTLERQLQIHLRDILLFKSRVSEATRRSVRGNLALFAGSEEEFSHLQKIEDEALKILNAALRQLFTEAVPRRLLQTVRRYPFSVRGDIYLAGASSLRAMQLCETYPILARRLYVQGRKGSVSNSRLDRCRDLVEEGEPLRKIAELANVSWALRKVLPINCNLSSELIDELVECPELLHSYLPQPAKKQKTWLSAVEEARTKCGQNFMRWVGRHCFDLGETDEAVVAEVSRLADWARASRNGTGDGMIGRRFQSDMSVETVRDLSDGWHRVVWLQEYKHVSDLRFPEPWLDGGNIDGIQIVPIRSLAELVYEGRRMRHCGATLAADVRDGHVFLYSIRRSETHLATLELRRKEGAVKLGQCRGVGNSRPSDEVLDTVDLWLKQSKEDEINLPELLDCKKQFAEPWWLNPGIGDHDNEPIPF